MVECFKIQLLSFDKSGELFNINKGIPIHRIESLKPFFRRNLTIIVADPFLFKMNNRLYLFYESKGLLSNGVIKMTYTDNLLDWSDPLVVLQESFHLSYPFVFEENNRIFMIPESGEDKSVKLYEFMNDDLTDIRFVNNLLVLPPKKLRMGFADSSIYKKSGLYYLMTTVKYENDVNCLELYYSEKIDGQYIKHPKSPIAFSNQLGRNAGCLLDVDGKLYRFSQDCTNRYGDNVNVSEVTSLSASDYTEHAIKYNIYPSSIPFYEKGGHHYNMVEFRDKYIVSTDAKEYHPLYIHRGIRKLVNILKKLLNSR